MTKAALFFFLSIFCAHAIADSYDGNSIEDQKMMKKVLKDYTELQNIRVDRFEDIDSIKGPRTDYSAYCLQNKNSTVCKKLNKILPGFLMTDSELKNLDFGKEQKDLDSLYKSLCGDGSHSDDHKINAICLNLNKRVNSIRTAENFQKLYLSNEI